MLRLEKQARMALWRQVVDAIEIYAGTVDHGRVTPELDPERLRRLLSAFDFERPVDATAAVDFVVAGLSKDQTHTPHPSYYGLFNPAPTTMGIAADTLVAAFNPQLAAWSHSPFAVETEAHLVRTLATRLGYDAERAAGSFTSGGAEANHTALLAALARAHPEWQRLGLRALRHQPTIYTSIEAHDSVVRAARLCGLGTESVREIRVDADLRMNVAALSREIDSDRERGLTPLMVVATAGTTTAGVVDPIAAVADVAMAERLWFHVDAAWGGVAAFVPELRPILDGIERADSITLDAHKWLSVPMGAGLFLTRHPRIGERIFQVSAGYMPQEATDLDVVDPYSVSMQWSRRFIGLKVFLSLAVAGWDGYREAIRHQTSMGELLREELVENGWRVVNETPLPVVCFVDEEFSGEDRGAHHQAVARRLVNEGSAWISTVAPGPIGHALRACVTNFLTRPDDIRKLVADLGRARVTEAAQ